MADVAGPSGASDAELTPKQRMAERMRRLRELHSRRTEAQQLNHKEVVEEDRRQSQPKNWERRQQWAERKLEEAEQRELAQKQGEDFDRKRNLDISAEDAAKWERRKRKHHNPDPGFSNYEASTARQYDRLVKQVKPDMEAYEAKKEAMGDAFYAGPGAIVHGHHKDTKEAIDRLAEDVNKQIEKRAKFSRRRIHDDEADIDYINERNMKFNKKLERFYGQYTQEIKQNLERGTAV
ncbi:pre-mRNA-splicing factor syf2-like [Amphibalanus amphitrite]|uniref:pre-mRNA-splicing factor syf2-like n=1 Tax=Amphibalanus amphitrite TaxID=1232801 RepID=UPI001C906004|nr:pre-mRNA-splicing factor syf2-like [Amphibalanus amphitrite]XP_043239156.1 pre-mRNA-splicing factor syf2-like [Amphibalanus amphitrite]XP_043239165.1 pre-mRNA-splicing factor syf2-like [Amphibalanus amphitrite]XP_043239171.1 pre-mRNA-splicing factor syf2-like [Amphibalanus amphitrite]XP_043239180.1 pre-mRNA-splicing factor syf2-like [Amphibalanus amphitrite]XP_043239188.1 pre-mRNA-splicing factor syf2-like [Amphibalanus amphitrite]XP_043239197.1 pre-mRNA-splicing factor syf2-like [Amphibal